jgi:cephalosporin-C deacetylase
MKCKSRKGSVMYTDMPEDQLRRYRGSVVEPADFDDFWSTTLSEARER